MNKKDRLLPVHPGEVLLEEFLKPLKLSQNPKFWMGLQMDYDLDIANDAIGDRLDKEIKLPLASGN